MPVQRLSGDPLLTQAQTLAFGHNARGRIELGPLETQLMQRYPAAFSSYGRRCRAQRQRSGDLWLWSENSPHLAFLTIRDSAVGATRLRYVQGIMIDLARDYKLLGISSLAIAPLGNDYERPELHSLVEQWLGLSGLPCVLYDDYVPGLAAEESLLTSGRP